MSDDNTWVFTRLPGRRPDSPPPSELMSSTEVATTHQLSARPCRPSVTQFQMPACPPCLLGRAASVPPSGTFCHPAWYPVNCPGNSTGNGVKKSGVGVVRPPCCPSKAASGRDTQTQSAAPGRAQRRSRHLSVCPPFSSLRSDPSTWTDCAQTEMQNIDSSALCLGHLSILSVWKSRSRGLGPRWEAGPGVGGLPSLPQPHSRPLPGLHSPSVPSSP